MSSRLALTASLLLPLLAGCAGFSAQTPKGFAAFGGSSPFVAVSPDDVVLRVRTEPNEPRADLSFWRVALKRRMVEAGYTVVREDEKAAGGKRYVLTLAAPLGQRDYGYVVAIEVWESRIAIIEVVGEVLSLNKRWPDVETALATITHD
jgi:hypothetical protein